MNSRTASWIVVGLAPPSGFVAFQRAATVSDPRMATMFVTVGTVIAASLVVLSWEVMRALRGRHSVGLARWRRPFALVAASVVTPSLTPVAWASEPPAVVVDVSTVVSPAIAGAALAMIIERRRSAVIERMSPRLMTDLELEILAEFRRRARESNVPSASENVGQSSLIVEVDPSVRVLLEAANEGDASDGQREVRSWSAIVRVLGYPEVVDAVGNRADFRKGKSLELLVWLCCNRDRMRRSAARTALWDVNVSDSTFATVMSEMRRALRELMPSVAAYDVARPTYTDAIDLTSAVVTDFDLLVAAHREFRSGGPPNALADALRNVRDVPFAGANYGWADYDGTTTRIVVAVIDASIELAQWALAERDMETATVALTAGLRTMPDHPDLLEVQSCLRQHRVLGV